ncbi:MAG: S8 family serine peptidase [Flavobacteriales bacterium]|nr:S8 family serine peptidase [Flavobacteriales bacterium]MCB9166414.1 S8 family serine peptidase [Flavobacteriales bacterium]
MRFPLTAALFLPILLSAQTRIPPVLELRSGRVVMGSVMEGPPTLAAGERRSDRIHRFIAFTHTLDAAERDKLAAAGIRFIDPLRPHAWSVSLPATIPGRMLQEAGAIGIRIPRPADKLSPEMHAKQEDRGWKRSSMAVLVTPWPDEGAEGLDRVRSLSGKPFETMGSEGARTYQLSGREWMRITGHPAVQWLAPAPREGLPDDIRGRTFHRVNPIAPQPGLQGGLDGSGVTVVVNDDGFVGPHIDFKGRTEQGPVSGDLVGDHGDMVAGIVGGAGNLDPRYPGMAPGATILVRQYQASLPNTVDLYQDEGAVIFNSSYSDGCNAGYTNVTRQVDLETVAHPAIIQVFSAGNNGGQDCGFGAGSAWGNVTGGHKIAKNCITTANLTDNGAVVSSSSRGPSADGRIKPDISAFGNGQVSTDPGNIYATGSGTSAASPGIAGTLAVLYQGWRELNGSDPSSGLIKAFVLNTADDLGTAGPDYTFGWGRINAARAWRAMEEGRYLTGSVDQGQSVVHSLPVPPGATQLRVMLYWMDPAAALQSTVVLVNDLDLLGIDPASNAHQPWQKDNAPDATLLGAGAFPGEDHVNNMEQVVVDIPLDGPWSFTVTGTDVPEGPQPYFIVYEYVAPGPRITYPLAGDVLTSSESHRLRWDAPQSNDPFDLSLSLDSGTTWTSLPPAPGTQRYYDLSLGDVVRPNCFLQVEQGGIFDITGPFTIMRSADDLEVVLNCVDSARIVWPKVPEASGYITHRLGANYMDSVGSTTDTSYVFTGLQALHNDWFAVTAIAPNGAWARRSKAIARPQQLIGCQAEFDAELLAVLSPTPLVLDCGSEPTVKLLLRNAGAQALNGIQAGYLVNDEPPVDLFAPLLLQPGDSAEVVFPAPLGTLLPDSLNHFEAWTGALSESFPPNDTLVASILSLAHTAAYPFLEDGEGLPTCSTQPLCGLACDNVGRLSNGRNGIEDALDWRVDTAGTSTQGTGPSVDHTMGNMSGRYFYLEASGGCQQQRGDLLTPCISLPGAGAHLLSYWFHLYGTGLGELHVDLFANGQWIEDAAPVVSGDQGDAWHPGTVDLTTYAGQSVVARFRGITGTSHVSDIALDDIAIGPATDIDGYGAAQDVLTLRSDGAGGYLICRDRPFPGGCLLRVLDATGRCVRIDRTQHRHTYALDLRSLSSGSYLVRLDLPEGPRTLRLVRP